MIHDAHGFAGSFAGVALGWALMMGLMMGPTVAPWIVAFGRCVQPRASRLASAAGTMTFAAGYLLVWVAFSIVAAAISRLLDIGSAWLGPLLLMAGLFQLTPLKRACLTHCRNPLTFLLTRWRDGQLPALRLGALHGMYCLGCCWALMITMLAVGVAHMGWMAAITVIVFAEQVAPGGARLRLPLAAGLVAAGGWMWLF